MNRILGTILLITTGLACGRRGTVEQEDQLYSRHLQRQVKLTIIHTPMPDNRKGLNLLLLNDGQDLDKLGARIIVDSLYRAGAIEPLVLVGIHAGDRMQEYGVTEHPDYAGRGKRAGYYDAFVNNELYPYAKKKSGVRSFSKVAIAGCSLGGLSAVDIAWNHPDKIDLVGAFSGAFWWRDKDAGDSGYQNDRNRILLAKIRSSRKRPGLHFWFYAGGMEEQSDRDGDGIPDVEDDTRDLIRIIQQKNIPGAHDLVYIEAADGRHDYPYWRRQLPHFLIWAFGKK